MAFISDVDEVVKEVRKANEVFVFMLFAKQRKPGRIQRSKTLSVKSIEFRNKTLNSDCDSIETLNWKQCV